MNRRRFLKYAGTTAAVVGASVLGLDYVNCHSKATNQTTAPVSSTVVRTTTTSVTTTDLQLTLFADWHGDGSQQSDEPSLSDFPVEIKGIDNDYKTVVNADSTGTYWARNIPVGSKYQILPNTILKYKYVALSNSVLLPIAYYNYLVTSTEPSLHLGIMEGFLTLPTTRREDFSESIVNYVDDGNVENHSDHVVRDWMGGHLTYKGHQGTDYEMEIGTEILAAAPGTVIGAEDDFQNNPDLSTIGNRVVIDHGHGFHSAYNHLSRIAVEYRKLDLGALQPDFQTVKRGELIAYSGNSPHVAPPHLHFESWPPNYQYYGLGQGNTIDPYRDLFYGEHGRALLSDSVSLWTKDNEPQNPLI